MSVCFCDEVADLVALLIIVFLLESALDPREGFFLDCGGLERFAFSSPLLKTTKSASCSPYPSAAAL